MFSRIKLVLPLVLAVSGSALAADKTFVIGNPRYTPRQVVTVESDGEFENFTGRTNQVSGTVMFDPAKKSGRGTLSVDLASLDTGIPLRNEHMRSAGWLDTEKHPKASFDVTSVRSLGGDRYRVSGTFTLKGVTRNLSSDAQVRYVAESASTKSAGFAGDVVQIRTKFDIKLADFGIVIPAQAKGKVAETVTISIATWGTTA